MSKLQPLTKALLVTDRQLNIVRDACELFDRLIIGQIDSFLWSLYCFKSGEIDHDEFQAACRRLKEVVFPELAWNESYGVGWKEDDSRQQASQIAYEIEAMIRHERWKREGKNQTWSTSSNPPLHYSNQTFIKVIDIADFRASDEEANRAPVDMVLYCPNCHAQHIDAPEPDICENCGIGEHDHKILQAPNVCEKFTAWLNPPHKSHRCSFCNTVWRPSDVPTNGVAEIKTRGERDTFAVGAAQNVVLNKMQRKCSSCEKLAEEIARLNNLINTPHTDEFFEAVKLEAAHQIERWGTGHDQGKQITDWMWLLGYLFGKSVNAEICGDMEKAKHHVISSAAMLLNKLRRLTGDDSSFQPGIIIEGDEKGK